MNLLKFSISWNRISYLSNKRLYFHEKCVKLYYWVKLSDGPNETCPIQISRPFVCFELLWANVSIGEIVFDQSDFVLIWNLAENSKRTNDFWAIPQFDSVFFSFSIMQKKSFSLQKQVFHHENHSSQFKYIQSF